MLFDFSLKSSLLLIFFVHGLVFTMLLLAKGLRNDDKPSLWLSAFTVLCTLHITPFMLGYAGWYSQQPYRDILFYIPFQQVLLLPPVLYLYCRSLLDNSFVFRIQDLVHFILPGLYLAFSVMVAVTDFWIIGEPFFYADGRDMDFDIEYQLAGFASLLVYLVLSLRMYSTYKDITYNTVSFADGLAFRWVNRFLISFVALLVLRALFFILNPEWDQFGRKFWYYLSFSILFYSITLSGILNSTRSISSLSVDPAPSAPVPIDLDSWTARIDALMRTERIYENPELSIVHLAYTLDTHPKKVSQAINQGFDLNFNDYVNRHRIQAVMAKLDAGEHHTRTLLGIALDCGFNSKSTFNRAFKRFAGMSPMTYVKSLG
jgi:AraC-like DNA-binding protein